MDQKVVKVEVILAAPGLTIFLSKQFVVGCLSWINGDARGTDHVLIYPDNKTNLLAFSLTLANVNAFEKPSGRNLTLGAHV